MVTVLPMTPAESECYERCLREWSNKSFTSGLIKKCPPLSNTFKANVANLARSLGVVIEFRSGKTSNWIFAIRKDALKK